MTLSQLFWWAMFIGILVALFAGCDTIQRIPHDLCKTVECGPVG